MLNTPPQPHNTTRPTIGLLIHSIARLGQTILSGIVDAAREQDVNVVCFEGGELCIPANRAQGNVLYEVVPKMIDGLICWGAGSFNYVSHAEFTRFLHRYRPCPMVTIGGTVVEDVLNVTINNREGMSRVVTHLIHSHGCRRIAYIHGKGGEAPSGIRAMWMRWKRMTSRSTPR
jgi:DNA-binding LacI/PurR family transcriptional regulator